MRNTLFAVAALLVSAQALKIKNWTNQEATTEDTTEATTEDTTEVTNEDTTEGTTEGEASWCDSVHPDLENLSNHLYNETFNTSIVWFDQMGEFWHKFNGSSAFYWFDCEHGNGDGKVTFDEFAGGLQDGYGDAPHCYEELHKKWVETVRSEEKMVTQKQWQGQEWRRHWETYAMITGDKNAPGCSYIHWMNKATTQGVSLIDAQTIWNYVANTGKFDFDHDITRDNYQYAAWKNVVGQTDYLKSQMVNIEGAVMESMWYFTQGCSDPSSYWFALIQDSETYGHDSKVELDYNQWMDTLCNNWKLCEDKM